MPVKINLLMLAQTPPPIHGAAIINQIILESLRNDKEVGIKNINISTSKSIVDMQKNQLLKIIKSLKLFFICCYSLLIDKDKTTYINASPSGASSIRDFIFVFIASLRSRKVFAHFHGQVSQGSVFIALISKIFFKKNVNYIFLDESLVPFCIKEKVKYFILQNCSPCEEQYSIVEKKNNNVPVVCFLANMLPAKGIIEFLEICSGSIRDGNKFQVMVAGGWTSKYKETDYNEWLTKNSDISKFFCHLGSVDQNKKVTLFSQADIFLYPTKNDAFPLVLLEAMANGVLTIASDVGAIKNIINDDSLVCQPNNIIEFRKVLDEFLADKEMLELKKQELKKRYYENFSKEKFQERLNNILRHQ